MRWIASTHACLIRVPYYDANIREALMSTHKFMSAHECHMKFPWRINVMGTITTRHERLMTMLWICMSFVIII